MILVFRALFPYLLFFDQWMYNLINMSTMDTMAFINQKELFDQFDKMASYATLSDADRIAYDADLKAYQWKP